jgi:uncharacterized protein YciI
MKIFFSGIAVLILILFACNLHEQNKSVITETGKYDLQSDTTVYTDEMKRFWLVHLLKGPDRNQDSASGVKIQAAHIANIERLAKEGKIIMAGPIGINNDLQGIFLMNCKDSAEVENFVRTDPAVMAGRLVMKYYPWWAAKGKYIFK